MSASLLDRLSEEHRAVVQEEADAACEAMTTAPEGYEAGIEELRAAGMERRACAEALAARSARVMLTDIDAETGRDVAEAIPGAAFAEADLRDLAALRAATDAAREAFDRLDVLVPNAALAKGGVVDAIEEED